MLNYLRTLISVWLMKLGQKIRPPYDGTVIRFVDNSDQSYTVIFNGVHYDLEDILNVVLIGISSKQLPSNITSSITANTNVPPTAITNNKKSIKYEQTGTLEAHYLEALFDTGSINEQDINDLYRMLVLAEPLTFYDLLTIWADCEAGLMPFQHVSRGSIFFAVLNYISHGGKTPKYPNDMPPPPPNSFIPA